MNNNLIITIGREYGAGGIEVGKRLAKELSISFYDKELLTKAAKISGIAEEFFHNYDEKIISTMYYFGASEYDAITLPRSRQLYEAQSKIIRKIASDESCVFIGRCADYILKDLPNCINIFLHANKDARAQRMIDVYAVPQAEVYSLMNKLDKQRSRYYNYITDQKWNNLNNYHLSIDTGRLGMDKTVKLILDYINL